MTKTNESGHAKIVANIDRLIASVIKMGKDYAPSNPSILIDALTQGCSGCKKALEDVGTATLAFRAAVKQREMVFENLNGLVSRIYNTLKASDKTGKSYETAKLYVRKIQGRRASSKRSEEQKKADTEAGITYNEVSASQMSYDSRVGNFGMLVKLAVSTPAYTPNEPDLKGEALKTTLELLRQKNAAVVSAASELFKARAIRNELLYREATGMVDRAMDAKTYLKGAFGSNSPQYREVSGLSFRKLIRN